MPVGFSDTRRWTFIAYSRPTTSLHTFEASYWSMGSGSFVRNWKQLNRETLTCQYATESGNQKLSNVFTNFTVYRWIPQPVTDFHHVTPALCQLRPRGGERNYPRCPHLRQLHRARERGIHRLQLHSHLPGQVYRYHRVRRPLRGAVRRRLHLRGRRNNLQRFPGGGKAVCWEELVVTSAKHKLDSCPSCF